MLNQNDKFDRFAEIINKNADSKLKKIEKETEKIRKQELQSITEKAQEEYKSRLAYEFQKIDVAVNKEISRINAESKKELADYREGITDKVFSLVKERLNAFTEGAAYDDFLENSIKLIVSNLEINNVEEYNLYVRQEDFEKVKKLSHKSSVKDVLVTDEILIGGIFAKSCDGKVKIDDSLDSRLDGQREWFKSKSKLSVL